MKRLLGSLFMITAMSAHGNESGQLGDLVLPDFLDVPGINQANPDLFPVLEEPGADADYVEEVVHSKVIQIPADSLKFKMTTLGYGVLTHKVIVPELASHTLFNHRNPGEEGPCLAEEAFIASPSPVLAPGTKVSIVIQVKNGYRINRETGACKVQMIEDVRTLVDDNMTVEFSHTYSQDMGFRYIGDCPK